MKKLLEFLVKAIVEKPKEVLIKEEKDNDIVNLNIQVHPDDLKIVIGKNGQTIRALRELVKIKAIRAQTKINVKIQNEA